MEVVMTPEEFADQMRGLLDMYADDEEVYHIAMDRVMCTVLKSLGYGEGVDIFTNAPKYYA